MRPGGMSPITNLVAIVRSSPPSVAARLISELPKDRMLDVVTVLDSGSIVRLLAAADTGLRATLMDALPPDRLSSLASTIPPEILLSLPNEGLTALANGLPSAVVSHLLGLMRDERRAAFLGALEPAVAFAALSLEYQTEVANALARANLRVTVPSGVPAGVVLGQGNQWQVVVAARYHDDGTKALRDAEATAHQLRVRGALSVTNLRPASDVVAYCRESQRLGHAVDAISWTSVKHDNLLIRTLVSLL